VLAGFQGFAEKESGWQQSCGLDVHSHTDLRGYGLKHAPAVVFNLLPPTGMCKSVA